MSLNLVPWVCCISYRWRQLGGYLWNKHTNWNPCWLVIYLFEDIGILLIFHEHEVFLDPSDSDFRLYSLPVLVTVISLPYIASEGSKQAFSSDHTCITLLQDELPQDFSSAAPSLPRPLALIWCHLSEVSTHTLHSPQPWSLFYFIG